MSKNVECDKNGVVLMDVLKLEANGNVSTNASTTQLQSSYEKGQKSKWTIIFLIVCLALAQYLSFSCIFILSSYFPELAENKGASGMQIGSIIGMSQCIFILAVYVEVYLMTILPPKTQLIGGLFISGICVIAFGFVDRIEDLTTFVVVALILRAIQGIGIAATDMCVFIIANKEVPISYLSTAVGVLECVLAAAVAVAPPFGGYLYEVNGFYLPFLVSGILCFIMAFVSIYVLPTTVSQEKRSFKDILIHSASFDMSVFTFHFAMGGAFTGFFGGMIEPHLRQFNLQPFYVGMVILVANGIQAVTFPFWGYLCDKFVRPSIITLIGYVLATIGLLFFGPFPGLPLEGSVHLCVFSLALCGVGIAAFLISGYAQANQFLIRTCPNQEVADTVISASYISLYNLGGYLGSLLGGTFVDYLGYENGSAVWFGLNVLGIILQVMVMLRK